MELIVAFLFGVICLFLVFFPTIVFFAYSFLVLIPLVLFFWLYSNYFHEILPIDLATNLVMLSALLILFPLLLFQIIAITLGLLIIKKLKNQQNNAFLLTKSAVGTFWKRLITYREIFLFFFLTYRKKVFYFLVHQWLLLASILTLLGTIAFLNSVKKIDVKNPYEVAQIYKIYNSD